MTLSICHDQGGIATALCRAHVGDVPVVQARIDDISDILRYCDFGVWTALAGITDLPFKACARAGEDVKANCSERRAEGRFMLYSGYIMPADAKGVHHCGSTFQRWLNHTIFCQRMIRIILINFAMLCRL